MDYDASSSYLGHVRVCINGTWSLICAQSQTRLDTNLSSVLCSSLGYSPYGNGVSNYYCSYIEKFKKTLAPIEILHLPFLYKLAKATAFCSL